MDPQSDEYYQRIDSTMRRRFPEHFGEEETTDGGGKPVQRTGTKSANVVAPASRSTSSKKIVLKQSQLAIAKKLGLTPPTVRNSSTEIGEPKWLKIDLHAK